MLKRLLALTLFISALLTTLSLATAQDATPPPAPEDPTGLDTIIGTPEPLPTMSARPAPMQVLTPARAVVSLYFAELAQGTVGLVSITGEAAAGGTATWLGSLIDFFQVEDEGYFGLLAVGMEQNPRSNYPLSISILYADGTRETVEASITITTGNFIRREVVLPPDKGYLLDAESERAELARLESLFARVTPERYWDSAGFAMPIASALTAPFGEFRVFNSTLNTRHTGWDIRCTTGTPVYASASGEVAFAGEFPIRGQYVIVDHGYGVYSGYAHLSVTHVTRGQTVTQGQVLGMTGVTGRTSGPHFHWEMAVNGEWIDSVQFLRMWMP
jgi:hypothetical protein